DRIRRRAQGSDGQQPRREITEKSGGNSQKQLRQPGKVVRRDGSKTVLDLPNMAFERTGPQCAAARILQQLRRRTGRGKSTSRQRKFPALVDVIGKTSLICTSSEHQEAGVTSLKGQKVPEMPKSRGNGRLSLFRFLHSPTRVRRRRTFLRTGSANPGCGKGEFISEIEIKD